MLGSQGQAICAGLLCLQCPLCRDGEAFVAEMFRMGIRIPFREPTWEDNDAFADLGERHSRCNAKKCLYPGGRDEAEEEGPWELLLCTSCAAEGTHRCCSGLRKGIFLWECDSCAGLGTAHRDELGSHSLARREPSHHCAESEANSLSSGRPGPLGLARHIMSSETSNRGRAQRAASQQLLPSSSRDPSSLSTQTEATSGSSFSSSPGAEDRAQSRHAGHDRGRNRSHQQCRTPNRRSRSRHHRGTRRSRRTSRVDRPRGRETPPQASPRRSRSHQRRQASNPPARPRRRLDRSRRRATNAGRPRHRGTPPGTSPRRSRSHRRRQPQSPPVQSRSCSDRSRRTSRADRHRGRETPPQASPRRSRSHQRRQASNPPARPRRRLDRSRRRATNAGRPRHRGTPPGTSPRRSRSPQRRRASTQTSSSST